MTRQSFAEKLIEAADGIDDLSRSDIQVLLRRAAIQLSNEMQDAGKVVIGPELAALFDELVQKSDMPITRNDAVVAALVDWTISQGYLDSDVLDEESEVDGNA